MKVHKMTCTIGAEVSGIHLGDAARSITGQQITVCAGSSL